MLTYRDNMTCKEDFTHVDSIKWSLTECDFEFEESWSWICNIWY
jgi:hypothetical protein